jgi:hypothetical protein
MITVEVMEVLFHFAVRWSATGLPSIEGLYNETIPVD